MFLVRHNPGPKSQFRNFDRKSKFCHNFEIVTSDFGPDSDPNYASPKHRRCVLLMKLHRLLVVSGNFVMKSRFACADPFVVRKHTKMTSRFCFDIPSPLPSPSASLFAGGAEPSTACPGEWLACFFPLGLWMLASAFTKARRGRV